MACLCTCPACGRVFRLDPRTYTWQAIYPLQQQCPDYPHRMTTEKWLREWDWINWFVNRFFNSVPRPTWTSDADL